ncbi:MAG: hypothetical protein L0338_16315, partial [Acidobacteria bacterium]|nr:hypothetical protein [Acidobacteriota bacterium]
DGLRQQLSALRVLLVPVLSSITDRSGPPLDDEARSVLGSSSSSLIGNWGQASLRLFDQVEQLCNRVRGLFAGTEPTGERTEAAIEALLGSLRQSGEWLQGLEARLSERLAITGLSSSREK